MTQGDEQPCLADGDDRQEIQQVAGRAHEKIEKIKCALGQLGLP